MEVLLQGELRNLWLSNNHTFFASVLRHLGFDVAKSSRNRQASREYTVGSQLYRRISAYVSLYALGLVDVSTILNNSGLFVVFTGSMIPGKQKQLFSVICRHDCTAVPYVGHKAFLLDDHHNNGTGARTFVYWLSFVSEI
jgi:hypothetical protein